MEAIKLVKQWPAKNISIGWLDENGNTSTYGDPEKIYELASVTKAIFSLAVLIAVEENTISLNQQAGPKNSTISHLLSHSSGLSFETKTEKMEIEAEVGTKRIYSNQGYDLLATSLEQGSLMPAQQYFQEAVANPLNMKNTKIYGSVASQGRSTVSDLLKLLQEIQKPSLLSSTTLNKIHKPHLPGLDGILPGFGFQKNNLWGLGFEIKGTKNPHWTAKENSPSTYGHFGRSGTFIWVDPNAQLSCVMLSDHEFGQWAKDSWPVFSKALLEET